MDKRKSINIVLKKGINIGLCYVIAYSFTACSTFNSIYSTQKPLEHIFTVEANVAGWQNSKVKVKKHQVVSCYAEGKWGDYFGLYGPEGNPENIKTHHGVSAPAYALLMRVSNDTNVVWVVGKSTSVVAKASGTLCFRCNISLTNEMRGAVKVYFSVADDYDGDGLSDYEELYIWKTNPRSIDTDGNGFSDYEDVMERRRVLGLFE